MTLTPEEENGLVIISALINFIDWLKSEKIVFVEEQTRADLVVKFLRNHSTEINYVHQADEIAKRLGIPFKSEEQSNARNEGNRPIAP